MQPPSDPPDEKSRMAALNRLNILDTPNEERFDRITRLARKALDVPIALISLIDTDRQWFKSAQGLDARETGRDLSFCGHAIHQSVILHVDDATNDERFANNPLVTGGPEIRMYAGRPIVSPDGHRVGTLCVIDRVPRALSNDELGALDDLAILVETELRAASLSATESELMARLTEAERRASTDELTRVWTRGTISSLLDSELTRSTRLQHPVSVLMIDVDGFKSINDTHGHPVGDAALVQAASRMRKALRPYDSLGRYGGDEFVAVLPECGDDEARSVAERLRKSVAERPLDVLRAGLYSTVSIGACTVSHDHAAERKAVIACADAALYDAKRGGRNRTAHRDLP